MKNKNFRYKIAFVAAIILLCGVVFNACTKGTNPSSELIGEDKNGNGIWDDVEPYIEKNAKTEAQRKALAFFFRGIQKALINPSIGRQIRDDLIPDYDRATFECLWRAMDNGKSLDLKGIQDAIVNNRARAQAYVKYNGNLSGGWYSLWKDEEGDPCAFKID